MKLKLPHRKPRPLPTRADLDKHDPQRRVLIALGTATTLISIAAVWWGRNGSAFLAELAFRMETIYIYWTLVASPLDRKVWMLIGGVLILIAILATALLHRFVWRAFFPDFARLDPDAHEGGMPERQGRLYRIRAFLDVDEKTRYRHYYKHGGRWLPLFRFDYADLDKPAEPFLFGLSVARCGRLVRDANGPRFKRMAIEGPYGSHPLEDGFRRAEVEADHARKTSIVSQGPSMNPDVMRRKAASQPSVDAYMEERSRLLGLVPSAPAEPPPVEES